MVRSNCLLLVLFLLMQCRTNQRTSAIVKTDEDGDAYIAFYSKMNGTTIKLSQDGSLSCLKESLLQSFQYNLPRLIREDLDVRHVYLNVTPFVTDSTTCEGLYIYSVHAGPSKHERITSKYVYRVPKSMNGDPYHFYAIKGNDVLFFGDDIEENKKKLADLKSIPGYQKILKYERNILDDLILIK